MPTQNDPKELKGFSSMDDRPDNNGNYLDEERLNPPGKVRSMYDDEEEDGEGIEDEDSMRDLWDDYNPNHD